MSTEMEHGLAGDEHIGADISPEFKQEIRVAAAKMGIPMSEFFRQALSEKLEDLEE